MPIREPRRVEVFIDDKFHRSFSSVNNAIRFLAEYLGISIGNARNKINTACRKNDGYILNLRFVKDPSYVRSRPVVAINLITGDYFIKPSVGKMAVHIFGKHDHRASAKITELCQSGKIHGVTGLIFKYIENGYVFSPNYHNPDVSQPILQLNRYSEAVIDYFHTVTNAAFHVSNLGVTESPVRNIAAKISSCANGKDPAILAPYGFKWRYVRHDEPAENVPLPPPDAESL